MNRFLNVTRKVGKVLGFGVGLQGDGVTREELSPRERMDYYEAYYHNNGLYKVLDAIARKDGVSIEAMKPLRNPVKSAVEFYVSTVWPGPLPEALPIETENKRILEPVYQLWRWSNWGQKKNVAVRQLAMTGSMFIRVATNGDGDGLPDKVYLQAVQSRNVSAFEVDHQGNVDMVRYDVPLTRKRDGRVQRYVHTELWSKSAGCWRIWEHEEALTTEIERLGKPVREGVLPLGFVPWTYTPFMDLGDDWGYPVHHTLIEKIDEVNRKATRLGQMAFRYNKPVWALSAGGVDSMGRPLPPPRMEKFQDSLQDDTIVELPGNSSLSSLVPDIHYESYRRMIEDDLEEIKQGLPEVRFYETMEMGSASGRALFYRMTPAILKAQEIRGAAENSLQRAVAMALSIGQEAGIWSDVGDYDRGELDFRFEKRDVIPVALEEQAATTKTFVDMGVPLGKALVKYSHWEAKEAEEAESIRQGLEVERMRDAERVMQQEGAVSAAALNLEQTMQEAIQAVSDGAIDALLASGALERLVERRSTNGNE